MCLPRFAQDVLDSFIDLEICSSASKSHHVKNTDHSKFAVRQLGNLLNSAIKSNGGSSGHKRDVNMAELASDQKKSFVA